MAFISELNFRNDGAAEFVEIVLGPGDDPADFVVSVYDDAGALHSGAGISGGEVTLSSLGGTPDPDNAAYTVYVIDVSIRNGLSNTTEGSGIALSDTSPGGGVTDFYSAIVLGSITATEGAANGASSTNVLDHTALGPGESAQWDIYGNSMNGPTTSGDAVLCITSETQVRAQTGDVHARNLKVGDLVWILDHGYQPIRRVGSKVLSEDDLERNPKNRPIRICQNALGNNLPAHDLWVSPQHRILGRSKIVKRMFGTHEVLVAATKLKEMDGVEQIDAPNGIHYIHFLFDHHEIIEADGALVESLLIADQSARIVDILDNEYAPGGLRTVAMVPARTVAEGKRCKSLIKRLLKNNKPFVDASPDQLDLQQAG